MARTARARRRRNAVRGGRFIDEIVDVALAIHRDLPGPVARDRHISHQPEQRVQLFGPRVGVFDQFKAVGAHRVVGDIVAAGASCGNGPMANFLLWPRTHIVSVRQICHDRLHLN